MSCNSVQLINLALYGVAGGETSGRLFYLGSKDILRPVWDP